MYMYTYINIYTHIDISVYIAMYIRVCNDAHVCVHVQAFIEHEDARLKTQAIGLLINVIGFSAIVPMDADEVDRFLSHSDIHISWKYLHVMQLDLRIFTNFECSNIQEDELSDSELFSDGEEEEEDGNKYILANASGPGGTSNMETTKDATDFHAAADTPADEVQVSTSHEQGNAPSSIDVSALHLFDEENIVVCVSIYSHWTLGVGVEEILTQSYG